MNGERPPSCRRMCFCGGASMWPPPLGTDNQAVSRMRRCLLRFETGKRIRPDETGSNAETASMSPTSFPSLPASCGQRAERLTPKASTISTLIPAACLLPRVPCRCVCPDGGLL